MLSTDSVTLDGNPDGALFYRVSAYAVDASGNKGTPSDYQVIIDEYNYYVDPASNASDPDGSVLNPFRNFADCMAASNSRRFARIHIKGTVSLPPGDTVFTSNCEILGTDDARISMQPASCIVVRSASLKAANIVFEKSTAGETENSSDKMFVLEHAVADFTACEIVGGFTDNGIVFTAYTSVIDLNGSGLTSQADSYTAGISSTDSKITVENCRISTIADTSVNFSVQGGTFAVSKTTCKVTGRLGRIAEIVGARCRITDNEFDAELEKKGIGATAVWKNTAAVTLEESGNNFSGF
jgi:hypothetical protein